MKDLFQTRSIWGPELNSSRSKFFFRAEDYFFSKIVFLLSLLNLKFILGFYLISAELLVGFYKYYESEFDFATQVVSPLEGRPITISDVVTSVKLNHGKDFKVLCVQKVRNPQSQRFQANSCVLCGCWLDFFDMELYYCETVSKKHKI